jgi:hypothetical protein
MEPLTENLPNMPSLADAMNHVVRVNDGNDSNVRKSTVVKDTEAFPRKFFNTAIPDLDFPAPVVLTVNPGKMTDIDFHKIINIPKNLMFVRVRTNMWNLETVVDPAVQHYSERDVPVILTFMAYFIKQVQPDFETCYVHRKRTMNSYHAITTEAWENIMARYKYNKYVYSCGKIEGEKGVTGCRYCGNCLREFFATSERIK